MEYSELKSAIARHLEGLELDDLVAAINGLREVIHSLSPFYEEPVDFVQWVKADFVFANDYNPNAVAPPEMELLGVSIEEDGYTQPIVAWSRDDQYEVVDGFHRNRVGKERPSVRDRVKGYLPVVPINRDRELRGDRMASTIRHNRARGSHKVELMSTIVSELVEMGKSDRWILKHVGMSADELLRLKQITGVAALFANRDFSDSWDAIDESEDNETLASH